MIHHKTLLLSIMCMVLIASGFSSQALAADTFVFAVLESENRQYSSNSFRFDSSHPWANDTPQWFMKAGTSQTGDSPYSVSLNSTPTGNIDLTYLGPYVQYPHFSYTVLLPNIFGGQYQYPSPGDDSWDGQDYTFTMGTANQVWNIPEGSLVKLPPVSPVSQGDEHPILTWDDVNGADAYQIMVLDWDTNNLPDFSRVLFASEKILDDGSESFSYKYTGDLLSKGIDMVFCVRALDFHPLSGTDPKYLERNINISSHTLSLRGHGPLVEDLSTWTKYEESGATLTLNPQDNTRYTLSATSTDSAEAYGQLQKSVTNGIGIMADVVITDTVSVSGNEWGAVGLTMDVADTSKGTYITAQIRLEWSGGSHNIHSRVRERNAEGSMYKEISRTNNKYGWWEGLTVPMGVAVVNNSVVFWAEGRGIQTVPLPKDITLRDHKVKVYISADPGPFTMAGFLGDVRIPTKTDPLIFGDLPAFQYDINGDGKKGLEEAIDALQVVSGIK